MKIKRLVLHAMQRNLLVEFDNSVSYQLPYEYLRVSTPNIKMVKGVKALISHKKQVILSAIECVGKHGYRLLFDDTHIAIYSQDYLLKLALEKDLRWQNYLTQHFLLYLHIYLF